MDRLIALVALRLRTDLRALARTRERLVGLLVAVPALLLSAMLMAGLAFLGLRALREEGPEAVLIVVSAVATFMGLAWAFSPLMTGLAFSECHDVSRLLHFPVPLWTLVASSLASNLFQPMVLAELPLAFAVALALSETPWAFPAALVGVLLSLGFTLAASHAVGLMLHGLSRNRRAFEWALALGVALSFLMSLAPLLLLLGGARHLAALLSLGELLVLSPFAWGARAAVHAGRGELALFLAFAGAAALTIGAAMALSAQLIRLVYRGELDIGPGGGQAPGPARLVFPGPLGALVEKDLRAAWRDPALRTSLVLGLLPLLVMIAFAGSGMAPRAGTGMLVVASFVGLSGFGSNALGLERRGLGLLLGFPVARHRLLIAKNLGVLALRLPGLLLLALAAGLLAPLPLLPAALAVGVATFLVAAGADNVAAVLFPVAAPDPARNPYAQASGGRGLGAALVSGLMLAGALALSAPFAFLCWLPLLLGRPWLWLGALPLAVGGAGAVYALLVAAAASLLERREPEVLERVLEEP